MEDKMINFDMQLFTEGDGGSGGGDGVADGGDKGGTKADDGKGAGDTKKMDDDKGGQLTQTDIDAAVAAKVAAEKSKWEKDFAKKTEAALKEKERLSKLSDDERKKAELAQLQSEFDKKEKELKIKEMKFEVVEDLAKRNIPVSFVDYLVDEDSEKTLARITNFEKEYKKAIDAAVNERLKGKTPKAGSDTVGTDPAKKAKTGFLSEIKKSQARKY